ncbi:MAG: carboxyl transferase domain-containing protein, partial [bacterium]
RAINAASGRRPVVVLANLSGFDGSPESLARWQLEYGAEIGQAVVRFDGSLIFVVLSRYHGGAYVVFSKTLNPGLRVAALEGSFASVIGGVPAATVVFSREVKRRLARRGGGEEERPAVIAEVAREYDAVHTIERARRVGSVDDILALRQLRPYIIGRLAADHEAAAQSMTGA